MRWRDGIIRLPESNCVWLSHFLSSPGPILLGLLGSYIVLKWLQGTARSVLGHAAWTSVARHDRHRWDSAEDTQRYLLGMDQRHPFCWELLFERNTRGAENLKQLRLEKKLQAKGHEKMLYITIHEGNANQNHEILPSTLPYGASTGKEDVEKKEPSRAAGGNAHWCGRGGKQDGSFSKN